MKNGGKQFPHEKIRTVGIFVIIFSISNQNFSFATTNRG